MLRDEAIENLLGRLDNESVATVQVTVEHGMFVASFSTRYVEIEGAKKPSLTDAMESLIKVLP